jgi:hypothetical protein
MNELIEHKLWIESQISQQSFASTKEWNYLGSDSL